MDRRGNIDLSSSKPYNQDDQSLSDQLRASTISSAGLTAVAPPQSLLSTPNLPTSDSQATGSHAPPHLVMARSYKNVDMTNIDAVHLGLAHAIRDRSRYSQPRSGIPDAEVKARYDRCRSEIPLLNARIQTYHDFRALHEYRISHPDETIDMRSIRGRHDEARPVASRALQSKANCYARMKRALKQLEDESPDTDWQHMDSEEIQETMFRSTPAVRYRAERYLRAREDLTNENTSLASKQDEANLLGILARALEAEATSGFVPFQSSESTPIQLPATRPMPPKLPAMEPKVEFSSPLLNLPRLGNYASGLSSRPNDYASSTIPYGASSSYGSQSFTDPRMTYNPSSSSLLLPPGATFPTTRSYSPQATVNPASTAPPGWSQFRPPVSVISTPIHQGRRRTAEETGDQSQNPIAGDQGAKHYRSESSESNSPAPQERPQRRKRAAPAEKKKKAT